MFGGMMRQFPYTNYHDMNLDWALQTVEEGKTKVDGFESELGQVKNDYEQKANITSARKLSEAGNFTGSVAGKPAAVVVSDLSDHSAAIAYLTAEVNAGAVTGRLIDGGVFGAGGEYTLYDGGSF